MRNPVNPKRGDPNLEEEEYIGPLTLTLLIDRSLSLYFKTFRDAMKIYLIPVILMYLILVVGMYPPMVKLMDGLNRMVLEGTLASPDQTLRDFLMIIPGFLILILFSITAIPLAFLSLVKLVTARMHGVRISPNQAYREGYNSFWEFQLAAFLVGLIILFLSLVASIPAFLSVYSESYKAIMGLILLSFFLFLLLAFLSLLLVVRFIFVIQSSVSERHQTGTLLQKAYFHLRRAFNLTSGQTLRLVGYFIVLTILLFVLRMVITAPVDAIFYVISLAIPSSSKALPGALTPGFLFLSVTVNQIIYLFSQPFFYIALTLIYYDLRCRKEGYDFALRMKGRESSESAL